MNSKFVLGALYSIFILGAIFILHKNSDRPKTNNNPLAHLSPPDAYYLGRNYPNIGEGDIAYKRAIDKAFTQDHKYRNANTPWTVEGPTNIGGRITTIAIHPTNAQIIYIGTPSSGVFKTTNGGTTWAHIYKQEKTLAIGSIAIDKSNPQVVYVGTGDNAMAGLNYNGNGIYKSTNGGTTWTMMGLQNIGVINKIMINPLNPQIIYAGAMGNIYHPDANRGLYKSTDGGSTWNNILYLGPNAGIGDMVMNETQPDTLFVTGRHRERSNSHSIVNGVKTRIYRSYNGGTTWDTLSNGLPTGPNCKITLAMSQTNPSKIYASYCDTLLNFGGLYKTTNSGDNWTLVSQNNVLSTGGFGWYFTQIKLDPTNDNTIYWLGVDLFKSIDGGVTWLMAAPAWYLYSVHADKHDLQFINSTTYLLATDGGLYIAKNGGGSNEANWTYISELPITQYYRVAYNQHDNTNYYGGAQDNGSSVGSLASGLNNWGRYLGGDGFQPEFDATDPNTIYAETQNGNIYATNSGGVNWDPISQSIASVDRCNWNMPYVLSKHTNNTMYTGTYKVYKNTNCLFDNWTEISGDLTDGTDDGNHNISAIDNSILSAPLIYAGTSDARVWVTKNTGASWTQINNIQMPNRYVSCIKASPNNVSAAFLSYWGYRDNDTTAYIYYTPNYGTTWTSIASSSLPNFAINDIWIRPDGTDSSIIIANDGGVYSTVDRGANWMRVGNNMPYIPVTDIDYNQALKKIFVGTYAMGIQSIPIDSAFKFSIKNTTAVVNTNKKWGITLYPNPCNSYFICEPNFEDDYTITIYNALGQVQQKQENIYGKKTITIDQLHNGNYFVSIENDKNKIVKTITKQ